MAAFVAATINTMLDWFTGKTTPAAVATRYITTYNGDPQGAGTENINTLNGSANRIAITASMNAASGGATASNALITLVASAVAGATVTHVAIFSTITGAGLMGSAAVVSKTLAIGDTLSILTGNLTANIT